MAGRNGKRTACTSQHAGQDSPQQRTRLQVVPERDEEEAGPDDEGAAAGAAQGNVKVADEPAVEGRVPAAPEALQRSNGGGASEWRGMGACLSWVFVRRLLHTEA